MSVSPRPAAGVEPGRTVKLPDRPLVSVLLFVRNGGATVGRCVASVVDQSYDNWELIVQDGASTDDTLAVIRAFDDPRIKIVSEHDRGPAEAFEIALGRATGEIFCMCLADEELLPHSLDVAVENMKKYPHIGAVIGHGYCIDLTGKIIGEYIDPGFRFLDLLTCDYVPYMPSSFFRYSAFENMGFFTSRWDSRCIDFELWIRLYVHYQILHIPMFLSKYGIHENQLSHNTEKVEEHLDSRLNILINHVFSANGVLGRNDALRDLCIVRHYETMIRHLSYWNADACRRLLRRFRDDPVFATAEYDADTVAGIDATLADTGAQAVGAAGDEMAEFLRGRYGWTLG